MKSLAQKGCRVICGGKWKPPQAIVPTVFCQILSIAQYLEISCWPSGSLLRLARVPRCSLGTTFLEPVTFFRSLALRLSESYIPLWGWCGERLRMSRPTFFLCLPLPPPTPQDRQGWVPHSCSLCSCSPALGSSCGGRGGGEWVWKGIFSMLMEGPDDLHPPGYEFRKPSLSTKCFPVCGHAADTNKNYPCHSELTLVLVGTWSWPEILKSVASVGREPPKLLDLQTGSLKRFLSCCAHYTSIRPGTRGSSADTCVLGTARL